MKFNFYCIFEQNSNPCFYINFKSMFKHDEANRRKEDGMGGRMEIGGLGLYSLFLKGR